MSLKVGKDVLEDLVQMDDLLMAMAESVMERQPKPFNPQLKFLDKKIDFKIGGRPPREIFYRKTTTFLTKLPPAVTKKLCTCNFLCTIGEQVPAVIKCHSCSIYDPSGRGYYCQHCFNGRHPWYRVQHIYTKIEQDENIEYNLKVAHRLAEAARYEREGNDLLENLQKEVVPKLDFIANDADIDDKMREYTRHVLELEEDIKIMRQRLQDDIKRGYVGKSYVTASLPPAMNAIGDGTADSDVKKSPVLGTPTTNDNPETFEESREDSKASMEQKQQHQQAPSSSNVRPQSEKQYHEAHPTGPIAPGANDQSEPTNSHRLESLPSQISLLDFEEQVPETKDRRPSVLLREGSQVGTFVLVHDHFDETLEEITRPSSSLQIRNGPSFRTDDPIGKTPIDSNHSRTPDNNTNQHNQNQQQDQIQQDDNQIEAEINLSTLVTDQHHRAAIHFQRIFKGYIGRKIVSSIMTTRIVRVFSPDYGRDFYYDRVTGLSAWTPHKLILPIHHEQLEYIVEPSDKVIWSCKNTAAIIKQYENQKVEIRYNKDLAVKILQGFGRCIISRHRILRFANRRYRRVLDTEPGSEGQFYYANIRTGETSWTKPKIYYTSEPPVYKGDEELETISDDDDDDNKASKKKKGKKKKKKTGKEGNSAAMNRSPRLNRI